MLPSNGRRSLSRLGGWATLSAAVHLLAGWLLWPRPAPSPAPPDERVLEIMIVSPRRAAPHRPRRSPPVDAPPTVRPVTPTPSTRGRAGETSAPAAPGTVTFGAPEDDLRRALRSRAGCFLEGYARLTQAEQEACDERLALAARRAAPLRQPLDPAERAAFERQAADNEAWRRYREEGGEYPGLRKLLRR